MKNAKQIFTTLLTLGALSMLTACGSSQQVAGSTDSSSRTPVTDIGSASSKALAYCNQASGNEITGKMKVFVDSSNYVRMEYVYLRLTSLPATFKSGNSYISLWKWLANPSGYTNLDTSALNFALMNPANGQYLTGWKTTLKWSDVVTVASGMGYTDPQTFFNNVNILVDLKDPNGEYDALKISNYDASTNKTINSVDGLLPLFSANPADYANDGGSTRAGVLQKLHPFYGKSGQFTTSQFQSMANNYCF
ncbi:hypothetical protein [Bdellovibrio bacteriovorus]|uniref:hypothetical protein n=1 Tax=Bdellovibrio bacteriovorus TaxID=959 RepID=UPI003A8014DF